MHTSDSQQRTKKCFRKNIFRHCLLQAGIYVRSSPYIVRFHIRGDAKNKNHFLAIFGPKKPVFGQKMSKFKSSPILSRCMSNYLSRRIDSKDILFNLFSTLVKVTMSENVEGSTHFWGRVKFIKTVMIVRFWQFWCLVICFLAWGNQWNNFKRPLCQS